MSSQPEQFIANLLLRSISYEAAGRIMEKFLLRYPPGTSVQIQIRKRLPALTVKRQRRGLVTKKSNRVPARKSWIAESVFNMEDCNFSFRIPKTERADCSESQSTQNSKCDFKFIDRMKPTRSVTEILNPVYYFL